MQDFLCRGCMIVLTSVTTVKRSTKKVFFLSTFGKINLTHLTTDVMFQGSVLQFSRCFFEVAWFLLMERLCGFFWRLRDFFWWRGCGIFLCGDVVFCWYVAWLFVWRGCMIFCCGEVVWFFSLTHNFFFVNFLWFFFWWKMFLRYGFLFLLCTKISWLLNISPAIWVLSSPGRT